MRKNKLLFLLFLMLLVGTTLIGVKAILENQQLKETSTLYCVMEDTKNQSKMELYFDYKDGEIYKYSIINTNKMTENIHTKAYQDKIEKNNNQYKGVTGKFWTDNNTYTTVEIYDLDLLSEQEFKELTTFSKKELKSKTRKEIIDSFIPILEDGSFQCN